MFKHISNNEAESWLSTKANSPLRNAQIMVITMITITIIIIMTIIMIIAIIIAMQG